MERGDLLSGEARDFLESNRDAISFPRAAATSPVDAAAYIARERSRLSESGGRDVARCATKDVELDRQVLMRLYRPIGSSEVLPTVMYFHGGGWVSGSVQQHDRTCELLVSVGNLVVCSLDYRLAPENPYPAALDDCREAVRWVRNHVEEQMGGAQDRVALCGSSSGGGLAAALALRLRDADEQPFVAQFLIYPALDSVGESRSQLPEVNGEGYFVDRWQMDWYWDQYVAGDVALLQSPYVSPIRATSLAGLPDTVIVTAEYDLLRDDGAEYHRRLLSHGVRSRLIHYPGQVHGFMGLFDAVSEAVPAVEGLARLAGRVMSLEGGEVWWDKQ